MTQIKRGRPFSREGECKGFTLNLEKDLIVEVDEVATEEGSSRSLLVSKLIDEALESRFLAKQAAEKEEAVC